MGVIIKMKYKHLIIFFLCCIILYNNVSAATNLYFEKSQDMAYGKVSLTDSLTSAKIEDIELKENTNYCISTCYAIKEITLYQESALIDSIYFKDMKLNKNKNIRYEFYIQNGYDSYSVDDSKTVCDTNYYLNGSSYQTCHSEKIGSHTEYVPIWKEYNAGDKLSSGNYTLKLIGHKNPNDVIDWVVNAQGKDLTQFAVWNSSFETTLLYYYDFNEGTGNIAHDLVSGNNLTFFGNYSWATGIRGNAILLNGSANTWGNTSKKLGIAGASQRTVNFWAQNKDNASSTRIAVAFGIGASNQLFGMGVTANTWYLNGNGGGNDYTFGTNSSTLLMHTIVVNATGLEWWINGKRSGNFTHTYATGDNVLWIGDILEFAANYWNGTVDELGIWNRSLSQSEIIDLYNNGFGLGFKTYLSTLVSPADNGFISSNSINFNCTQTATGYNLRNATLFTSLSGSFAQNQTKIINGTTNATYFSVNISVLPNSFVWNCYICDEGNSCAFAPSNFSAWSYFKENNVTYTNPITEGSASTIIGNFYLNFTPTYFLFTYNNTNYTPSVTTIGSNYIASATVQVPIINTQTNISFYYTFNTGDLNLFSTVRNQTVNNLILSTNCSTGNFNFINITNFDEESLLVMNGTVEYVLSLQGTNDQISVTSGNTTNTTVFLCSNTNLTDSFIGYNLQLRYYANGYVYKTYNVVNSPISNIPIAINLFYLNSSIGTKFKISYVDFNYLKYPGAIMQVQRQYLATNTYNVVEIPLLDNNGEALASFNTNNIKYKLIVINNGVVLDTFNDIFPSCQNLVIGDCQISLRGSQAATTTTTGDFTYSLVKTNTSLILTYVIPSGTPRTVEFITNQNSRFLSNISTCDTSIFASGGTITCTYNDTVGDSIITTQIINSDGTHLYGSVLISEDLSSFFLLNNYFIAAILVISLGLMFITSGMALIVVSVIAIIFLGFIFLLRGVDFVTLAGSIGWIVIAAIIVIYKISQKEERT